MMLSELEMSNLSPEQSDRILKVADDVAMEIDDPDVRFNDVIRMFAQDVAELDRWEAAAWD